MNEEEAIAQALADGQVRIMFKLDPVDGFPPTDRERLWAASVGRDAYRLLNTPFFLYGVSKEDHVEAFERDGELFFHRLLHSEGHSTVRVIVYDHTKLEEILNTLRAFGCACEQAVSWNPHYIAVDVPPTVNLDSVHSFLSGMKSDDKVAFEGSNIVHPGTSTN
jgi:hypothetical protein